MSESSESQPIMSALAKRVLENERERRLWRYQVPDLAGEKFARLTVIRRDLSARGKPRWQCICICGNVSLVTTANLMAGSTRSCGCLRDELARVQMKKNGVWRWAAKARKAAA